MPARSFGPWLWSPKLDLSVFGGSVVFAFAGVFAAHLAGVSPGPLPVWGWLLFVLGVDVAHVYATLFRTYLDPHELRRKPLRYIGVPLAVYAVGVALYAHGALTFWRLLAYVAVLHFVKQQVGWVAVYRARETSGKTMDRWVDNAAVYSSTLYPIVHWHAHLGAMDIHWFLDGDFIASLQPACDAVLPWARAAWVVAMLVYVARQSALWRAGEGLRLGKSVVVFGTAFVWYGGIVWAPNDFDFSVTNVIAHGVPYVALLWMYALASQRDGRMGAGAQIVRGGLATFLAVLLLLAGIEEFLWNRLIWQDRAWLFGGGGGAIDPGLWVFVVPLLSLPQATHYVLDGMIWRRSDTAAVPSQQRALGVQSLPPATADRILK